MHVPPHENHPTPASGEHAAGGTVPRVTDLVRRVPGEGPKGGVMVLAEAPGAEEDKLRRPLVGPTGRIVEDLFAHVGWDRRTIRLDNVIQRRPPGNKLKAIPSDERKAWMADARARVRAAHPTLIVALGGLAQQALTGKPSIEQWRGSIGQFEGTPMLATYHPAFTFKDPVAMRAIERDFERADLLRRGGIEKPERTYRIRPSIEEVELFASIVQGLGAHDVLTLDIETPGHMACIGFSHDPTDALCVPTTRRYWTNRDDYSRAWRAIRAMCGSDVAKVLMHGFYDTYWLRMTARVEVRNWHWDLMAMHHALAPNEPHSLAYICSMFNDWYVFWKTEAKDPETVAKYAKDIDALYTYNCMDCCEQRRVFDPLYAALKARALLDFYDWHYRKLTPHMLDMMCHGFRVAERQRAKRAAECKVKCIQIEDELAVIAGKKVHAKKSFSRIAIEDLVYTVLKCPKHYNIDTGALTTDVFTIQKLTHKYPKKMGTVGPLILTHRKEEKLAQFLDPAKVDSDNRFRSSYGFDPYTGRFSSSPNPMGTGDNAQNQDRRIRDTFLADHGHVLVKIDRSQVESRICDMLTGDPWHIERARAMPWERDVHVEVARRVFGGRLAESGTKEFDEQRYLCKRGKYAGIYDITGGELSRQLSKEGVFIDPLKCQQIIDVAIEQPIRQWQMKVRGVVMAKGIIGNSWGWTFDFHGLRLDRETYKKAYAFSCSSENAFDLHHMGFYPLATAIKAGHFKARINASVHDEVVVSARPEDVYRVMLFVRRNLERPRVYSAAGPLTVPITYGLGPTWQSEKKWDWLPSEEEVMAYVTERAWE